MIASYEAALEANPLLTKSVTSGTLYGIGDCIAQSVERRNEPSTSFDTRRCARAVAFGGLFYPGIAHLHYNFLERLVVVRWGVQTAYVPFTKMFIEQFVYCARSPPRTHICTIFAACATHRSPYMTLILAKIVVSGSQGATSPTPTTTPSSARSRA